MQENEIKREFKKRKKRQLLLSGLIIIVIAALVFMPRHLESPSAIINPLYLIIGLAVLIIIGMLASFMTWRCPACEKYLGKSINPRFCKHCGAKLVED